MRFSTWTTPSGFASSARASRPKRDEPTGATSRAHSPRRSPPGPSPRRRRSGEPRPPRGSSGGSRRTSTRRSPASRPPRAWHPRRPCWPRGSRSRPDTPTLATCSSAWSPPAATARSCAPPSGRTRGSCLCPRRSSPGAPSPRWSPTCTPGRGKRRTGRHTSRGKTGARTVVRRVLAPRSASPRRPARASWRPAPAHTSCSSARGQIEG